MVEHTVYLDTMGGSTILSCEGLQIKNIEYPYKEVDEQHIKKVILDYKYMSEEHADFDLIIMDNRPRPENYNVVKERESKEFKKNNNSMRTPKR